MAIDRIQLVISKDRMKLFFTVFYFKSKSMQFFLASQFASFELPGFEQLAPIEFARSKPRLEFDFLKPRRNRRNFTGFQIIKLSLGHLVFSRVDEGAALCAFFLLVVIETPFDRSFVVRRHVIVIPGTVPAIFRPFALALTGSVAITSFFRRIQTGAT